MNSASRGRSQVRGLQWAAAIAAVMVLPLASCAKNQQADGAQPAVAGTDMAASGDSAADGSAADGSITGRPAAPPTEPGLYVAPNGSDTNAGTAAKPFKTIAHARDALRTARKRNPAMKTIYLRGGAYRQTTTLTFTNQDSDTTYRSYPGERAAITGGVSLKSSQFRPVRDAQFRNRIPAATRDKAVELDLGALGIKDIPAPTRVGHSLDSSAVPPELFVDGRAMTLARWPNTGFMKTANTSSSNNSVSFASKAAGKNWKNMADAMVFGYLNPEWADVSLRIGGFNATSGAVTTTEAPPYGIANGKPYYFFNILEEMDTPGEYYIDRKSKKLFLVPPAQWESKAVTLSTLDAPILSLVKASNVTIRDLTIESGRNIGVSVSNGTKDVLENVTVQSIGKRAIRIEGGRSVGVRKSIIRETGMGGVDLVGGNRVSLTPGRHFVEDTTFSTYSRIRHTDSPAVYMSGVGNHTSHNEMKDSYHFAVLMNGNEHVVEYNHIHNIITESGDAGTIYLGRDWSSAGNVIRYNYIHDIGSAQYNNQNAIYLDDLASGTTVHGNTVARTDIGILLGGGRNNTLTSNVIVSTTNPIVADDRGLNWAAASCTPPNGVMWQNLLKVPYQSAAWTKKYPWISKIAGRQPCKPMDNTITSNIYWKFTDPVITKPYSTDNKIVNNWLAKTDPGFGDATKSQYSFKPNKPDLAKVPGFAAPPFDQVGVRR